MTKRRQPQTIEHAIDRAAGLVGYPDLAGAMGKSESWVRKCADPDLDGHNLHFKDAAVIDRLCLDDCFEAPMRSVLVQLTRPDDAMPIRAKITHSMNAALSEIETATMMAETGRMSAADGMDMTQMAHRLKRAVDELCTELLEGTADVIDQKERV